MPGSLIASSLDSLLTRATARARGDQHSPGNSSGKRPPALPCRYVATPLGRIRVHDSGAGDACVILVPDGPNVIEHYADLIGLLAVRVRVVCFDMPGFGHSLPALSYRHSLDDGVGAVLGVMEALGVRKATLAFSCANGFYALRAAQCSPDRFSSLVLSQTPSLGAMHAWTRRIIPGPIRVPVLGQALAWLFREKVALGWYEKALPRWADPEPWQAKARHSLACGGCFCLAGVVQGLMKENPASLEGVTMPVTIVWGARDASHRETDPGSALASLPQAEIIRFEDCGHFPDIEQAERFSRIVLERVAG